MVEIFEWWIVAEIVGFSTFALFFGTFRGLADRGLSLSKPLGLLLVAFTLWLLGSIHAVQNTVPFVVGLVVILAAAGMVSIVRRRSEIGQFLASHWEVLLFQEALFIAWFTCAAYLRSFIPEISGTEKPFEFGILNTILLTDYFPPKDPWFAGANLSYYYLGYVVLDIPAKIADTPAAIAFNVGLAFTAALAALTIFGMVYNLVTSLASRTRSRLQSIKMGVIFGMVGVGFLLILSNLEGVLEFLAVHGFAWEPLYSFFNINGLEGPKPSPAWYPNEHWWWWRATRLTSGWNVMEFPFFSFLLGDLHAHVMTLPFATTALMFTWNLLRRERVLQPKFWIEETGLLVLGAIVFGALGMMNAWDLPAYLGIFGVAVLIHNRSRSEEFTPRTVIESIVFAAPLAMLSVLIYLPFYRTVTAALGGVAPILLLEKPDYIDLNQPASPLPQMFLVWGPLFWVIGSYAIARLAHGWRFLKVEDVTLALLLPGIPVAVWLVASLRRLGASGLLQELSLRGTSLLSIALIVFVLLAVSLAALAELRRGPVLDATERLYGLVLATMAILLILGTELFFVVEILPSRHNTVFKLYFTAWLLLSISGALGLADLRLAIRRAKIPARTVAPWAVVTVLLLALGLVYPINATFARTNGFSLTRTLDGQAYMEKWAPMELAGIEWVRLNAGRNDVILEGVGGDYTDFGRISAATGIPAVLGWPSHQWQQRGSLGPINQRQDMVREIYSTSDARRAELLLQQTGATLIYVGRMERNEYKIADLSTFDKIGTLVYQNPDVSIYRFATPSRSGGFQLQ